MIKLLSRVQAVLLLHIILVLATNQEPVRQNEFPCNIGCHNLQQNDISVFGKHDSLTTVMLNRDLLLS